MHVSNPQARAASGYSTLFCVRLLFSSADQRWVPSASRTPCSVPLLGLWVVRKRALLTCVFPRCMLPSGETCSREDSSYFSPLRGCTWLAACAAAAELAWNEQLCPHPQRRPQLLFRLRSSYDPPGPLRVLPSGDKPFSPSAASVPQPWVKGKIFSYERPQSSQHPPQCR